MFGEKIVLRVNRFPFFWLNLAYNPPVTHRPAQNYNRKKLIWSIHETR